MRLNPGRNIGHFEILGQLGAGGMGEVYLALDKQLNRKVALKILPLTLAAKQDRLRRFNQEASTAAALRDGQKIALSRGIVNRDVVLITGFK